MKLSDDALRELDVFHATRISTLRISSMRRERERRDAARDWPTIEAEYRRRFAATEYQGGPDKEKALADARRAGLKSKRLRRKSIREAARRVQR